MRRLKKCRPVDLLTTKPAVTLAEADEAEIPPPLLMNPIVSPTQGPETL